MTKGWLFYDDRDDEANLVLFLEGFDFDEEDDDNFKTMEIRSRDFQELHVVLHMMYEQEMTFELVGLYEPDHFEEARREDDDHRLASAPEEG